MEEEKSILDSVYKVCTCCGQKRTLRNFRLLANTEFDDELRTISEKFSKVCKCCEKKGQPSKAARIETIAQKLVRYKQNAAAREHEEQRIRFNREKPIKVKKHKEWNKVNLC